MIYIAHRGNVFEKNIALENTPDYVMNALSLGFDVEVDVWCDNNKFYLGHDAPSYQVSKDFLLQKGLWCHAKNILSLFEMSNLNISHYFWHQEDCVTLTSSGYFWTFPGKELTNKSICVMPELFTEKKISQCAGICSDVIFNYKESEKK